MPKQTAEPRHKLVLEFPERVRVRLDAVQARVGADSHVEVLRRAVAVYDALTELGDDAVVVLRRGDGTEETVRFF